MTDSFENVDQIIPESATEAVEKCLAEATDKQERKVVLLKWKMPKLEKYPQAVMITFYEATSSCKRG